MFFHEPEPGSELLDLLPGRPDSIAEPLVFGFEFRASLPELGDVAHRDRGNSADRLIEICLCLETATPPSGQLGFQRVRGANQRC